MTKKKPTDPTEFQWSLMTTKGGADDADRKAWEEETTREEYVSAVLGWRLRFERKRAHLTQEEAAGCLGVSAGALAGWETGEHDITLKDAHRLVRLYGRFIDASDWEKPRLDSLTAVPMTTLSKA